MIGVTIDSLRNGLKLGKVPGPLHEPLQSLLPHITRAAAETPTSIYLFSNEENAETRDLFGYALANALLQHVPSTLLVDCGFLNIGMSGVVPQKDALGFLDLLLYGSSLGVITQETTGGVHVVGAGSFPVTKKMPFVLNAFEDAARRLVTHSRCAIFCGPLHDDDGELHPLIGAVDKPVLVRTTGAGGSGVVDPIEEQISTRWGVELTSVRITPVEDKEAPSPVPPAPAPPEPPVVEPKPAPVKPSVVAEPEKPSVEKPPPSPPQFEEIERPESEPQPAPREKRPTIRPPDLERPVEPEPAAPIFEESGPEFQEKKYTSLIPKIATLVIVIVVVVFVVWWFKQERPTDIVTTPAQEPPVTEVTQAQPTETGAGDQGAGTVVDTTQAAAAGQQETESTGAQTPPAQAETTPEQVTAPVETETERTPPAGSRLDSNDIHVMDDLGTSWAGYHLVHVSSFRESSKARTEVANLENHGFPVFIVFLDLGPKGKWYRVYAGPLDTRDEARNMKKLLDDTPGVRFTRITRIAR
jgi:hypothetical protein